MRKTISCLLMVLAVPALGQATDDSKANDSKTGGSNIGLAQYPGPNCTKPQLPVQPSAKLATQKSGSSTATSPAITAP